MQLDLVGWGLMLRDWVVGGLTEKDVDEYGFVRRKTGEDFLDFRSGLVLYDAEVFRWMEVEKLMVGITKNMRL